LSGGFMNWGNLTQRVLGHRAIPISQLLRQELVASIGLSDPVDYCVTAYTLGEYSGLALGVSVAWSAGLSAGSSTVIYSPLSAVTRAQGFGAVLGTTPIGALLNFVDKNIYEIPRALWYAASGTYAANASGRVSAVVPSVLESVGKIARFEMRILNWRNIPIDRQ